MAWRWTDEEKRLLSLRPVPASEVITQKIRQSVALRQKRRKLEGRMNEKGLRLIDKALYALWDDVRMLDE